MAFKASTVADLLPNRVEVTFLRRWTGRYGEDFDHHEHFRGESVEVPRPLAARLQRKNVVECDAPLTVNQYWHRHLSPQTANYESKTVSEIEDAVDIITDQDLLEYLLDQEKEGKDRTTAKDAIEERMEELKPRPTPYPDADEKEADEEDKSADTSDQTAPEEDKSLDASGDTTYETKSSEEE